MDLGGVLLWYKLRLFILESICGFDIPLNVCDKGLSIAHRGTIIINSNSRIGCNCRIHVGVVLGTIPGVPDAAPVIGNDTYIGPGAKLYGNIKIGNGCVVGANSVVNKSFTEDNICIAGAPAKIISKMGRSQLEERNRTKKPN